MAKKQKPAPISPLQLTITASQSQILPAGLTHAETSIIKNFRKLNREDAEYILMICEGFGAAASAGIRTTDHLKLLNGGVR